MTGRATNITTQTTTTVHSVPKGILHRVVVNKAAANGVITIYDGTAAQSDEIATITCPATLLQNHFTLEYGVESQRPITVVTSGANQDITVVTS